MLKTEEHWKKIGFRHHHGIAVPLFSLRTKKSCGIGEFLDLIPLIDWCKSLGLDVIQLLPLNDTGSDPSPYNPVSSCALDPIYLTLTDLPNGNSPDLSLFAPFMTLPRLAKIEVKREKLKWLFTYFQKMFPEISKTAEYQKFREENAWLPHYCLFKALKDEYGGKAWKEWPEEYQTPNLDHIRDRQETVHFQEFLQFLCFSQMEKVRTYASKQGVFLKGDLPILVSPDSAGVWAAPSLFNLELSAGAPPDFYNILGQKWGFPLFRWEEHRKTNFAWWKQRLAVNAKLYHIYRIDHIVGFFRIWAIPPDKNPTDGFFVEADRKLWVPQGKELLEMMIDSCPLLPIGEDLGTIPKEVRPLMRELGICGTNVIRWHRHWDTDKSFIPYEQYDSFTLTTLSTADADITKMWWKKFPDEALAFSHFRNWPYQTDLSNDHLFELLQDSHHTPSYFHINLLQEYLSLHPDLIAPNLEEERINVPGTVLPTNWTHRYRPSIEELIAHQPLADTFRNLLKP